MQKKDDILKYIKTEKDVANFRIERLKKSSSLKPSKRRVLNIEEEFVALPLETFPFEDVADVAAAISIYRDSRALFYKTYDFEKPKELSTEKLLEVVKFKCSYLSSVGNELITSRVNEVNLVQDESLFYELSVALASRGRKTLPEKVSELDCLDLSELNILEPICLSKKRARMQAMLYSAGLYILNELRQLPKTEGFSQSQLSDLIKEVDSIPHSLSRNIFKYYNDSLYALSFATDSKLGRGASYDKVHPLKDVLDFSSISIDTEDLPELPDRGGFSFASPILCNVLTKKAAIGQGFDSEKRKGSKSKTAGILLPIQRVGNEKMTLMYGRVYACGYDVTNLMDDSISNIKTSGDDSNNYFKAWMMKPLWKLIYEAHPSSDKVLKIIFGVNRSYDLNQSKNIDIVNSYSSPIISLGAESSILIPKTRSEEDAFSALSGWLENRVGSIIGGYDATTNDLL